MTRYTQPSKGKPLKGFGVYLPGNDVLKFLIKLHLIERIEIKNEDNKLFGGTSYKLAPAVILKADKHIISR